MPVIPFGEIEALEQARGASPQQAIIGAAIVEAESGGSTTAQGDVSFGQGGGQYVGSLGMWQIFGQAHPQVTAACAMDPACSTDAARQISSNWTDWSPWTTFKTGAYRQFLGGATDAAGQAASDAGGGVSAAAGAAGAAAGPLAHLATDLGLSTAKDLLWRGAFIVVGLVFIFLGIQLLLRPVAEQAVGFGARMALRGGASGF